jgi:hypothetical protein
MIERSPRLSRLTNDPRDQGNIQVTAENPAWGCGGKVGSDITK